MNNERSFHRLAGWAAIVAFPLAYYSLFGSMAAMNFNLDGLTNPAVAVKEVAGQGHMLRWAFFADALGFYLLLIPLALVLWNRLRSKNPQLIALFTVAGIGYTLLGAMGAAIFAIVLSGAADTYAQVTGVERQIQEGLYVAFSNAVQHGIWGTMDGLLAGVWWLGIGSFLRNEQRAIGWVTIVLGCASLLAWIGGIVDVEAILTPGLMIYLYLAPVWGLILGIGLLRQRASDV